MVEAEQPEAFKYEVSFELKKHFNPSEITGTNVQMILIELIHVFKVYDKNKDGTMDSGEFKQVLIDLGKRDITED